MVHKMYKYIGFGDNSRYANQITKLQDFQRCAAKTIIMRKKFITSLLVDGRQRLATKTRVNSLTNSIIKASCDSVVKVVTIVVILMVSFILSL